MKPGRPDRKILLPYEAPDGEPELLDELELWKLDDPGELGKPDELIKDGRLAGLHLSAFGRLRGGIGVVLINFSNRGPHVTLPF